MARQKGIIKLKKTQMWTKCGLEAEIKNPN